jgi:hypothetical protein
MLLERLDLSVLSIRLIMATRLSSVLASQARIKRGKKWSQDGALIGEANAMSINASNCIDDSHALCEARAR